MCTVTLKYDHNNALARRKLASLLASGLFFQTDIQYDEPTPEELQNHEELRKAILDHSRRTMSHLIEQYHE